MLLRSNIGSIVNWESFIWVKGSLSVLFFLFYKEFRDLVKYFIKLL